MQKILHTTEQTTEEELKLLVKKAPKECNIVKVTFSNDSGLEKYVEKNNFSSYHCHIKLEAEIGIATIKKGKVLKFKSIGWPEISKEEIKQETKEKIEVKEETENELVYPEPDTTAYKVWQISDRFYMNTQDHAERRKIPDIEIIIKAAQGISIKKVATKAHFNKWKKWKLSQNEELTRKTKKKGRKPMAKKKAKKKPAVKKAAKTKTPAKKKPGRPPGKAAKKVSKRRPLKKDPAKKKAGRPPKSEAGNRKLATKPKGQEHYYRPSSNTSIV